MSSTEAVDPSEQKAQEAIQALAKAIKGRKWEFPIELENPAWMAVAWLIRASRTAESIALLYERGFSSEAAPLVRSVIERTASIAWLVTQKNDAIPAITHRHRVHQSKLAKEAKQGGWSLERSQEELGRIDALLQPLADQSVTFPKVEQLCQKAGLKNAYLAFRIESGMTHATYLSGAAYWREKPRSDRGFHYLEPEPGTSLRGPAAMVLIAAVLVDEISPDLVFQAGLKNIQEWLGIYALNEESD